MPQTRSQAQHQAETATDSAVVSPLTKFLSNYDLLFSLCGYLDSADLVHLAEVSKEHWLYIGADRATLKTLMAQTSCDGIGIAMRAGLFEHWRGDPAKADVACHGKDAKPCADCGAMVCDQCRFHTHYGYWNCLEWRPGASYSQDDDWDDIEQRNSEEPYWLEGMKTEEYHSSRSLELKTALKVAHTYSRLYLCDDCHPLHITRRRPWKAGTSRRRRQYLENHYNRERVPLKLQCQCSIYTCLVEVWRCIPCVLAKKADLKASRHQYRVTLSRKAGFEKRMLCGCGKVISEEASRWCKLCNKVRYLNTAQEDRMLKRILEQLGNSPDGRGDDPILSQLG